MIFVEDDMGEVDQKSKMYYHLCCWDTIWDDFDDSRTQTRLSFHIKSWYIGTFAKNDHKYVWFIVSKDIAWAKEYINHNYGLALLQQWLNNYYQDNNLDAVNYIDWLYIYPEFRNEWLGWKLLQYHESISKSKWYHYSLLEFNTTEKPYLLNFYSKYWYIRLFDYIWTHKSQSGKSKTKTLMIKKI